MSDQQQPQPAESSALSVRSDSASIYAIIATSGRQYKVSPGDVIEVDKRTDAEGETVTFDKVLLRRDGGKLDIGTPYVHDGAVSGKIIGHDRARKIEVTKFKRRKRYLRRLGHRQPFTTVEITSITA